MKKKIVLKIGDVFCIPLLDDKYAYCQYVYESASKASMIRVSNKISTKPMTVEELGDFNELLFEPVFAFLRDAVKDNNWFRIGNLNFNNFKIPTLKSCWYINETKQSVIFRLVNGNNFTIVDQVDILDPLYKNLEYDSIYVGESIEFRIRKGICEEGIEIGAYGIGMPIHAPLLLIKNGA